jgi:hypothetical protein
VPDLGKILSLVVLHETYDIDRLLKVQESVSGASPPNYTKESVGTLYGALGKEGDNTHLGWAFSEAAVRFLCANPEGQTCLMLMPPMRMEIEIVNTSRPSSLCCDVCELGRGVVSDNNASDIILRGHRAYRDGRTSLIATVPFGLLWMEAGNANAAGAVTRDDAVKWDER